MKVCPDNSRLHAAKGSEKQGQILEDKNPLFHRSNYFDLHFSTIFRLLRDDSAASSNRKKA